MIHPGFRNSPDAMSEQQTLLIEVNGSYLRRVQFVQKVQIVQNVLNGLNGLNVLNQHGNLRLLLAQGSIGLTAEFGFIYGWP
jgi:hypothetical protein